VGRDRARRYPERESSERRSRSASDSECASVHVAHQPPDTDSDALSRASPVARAPVALGQSSEHTDSHSRTATHEDRRTHRDADRIAGAEFDAPDHGRASTDTDARCRLADCHAEPFQCDRSRNTDSDSGPLAGDHSNTDHHTHPDAHADSDADSHTDARPVGESSADGPRRSTGLGHHGR